MSLSGFILKGGHRNQVHCDPDGKSVGKSFKKIFLKCFCFPLQGHAFSDFRRCEQTGIEGLQVFFEPGDRQM